MKLIVFKKFDKLKTIRGDIQKKVSLEDILNAKPFKRIPWRFVEKGQPVGWSGKEGCLLVGKNDRPLDILHEFCHYLLCPSTRLKHDEFGLGQGFRTGAIFAVAKVPIKASEREECAVCVLAYSFMLFLKVDPLIIRDEIWEQSFYSVEREELQLSRTFIRKRKKRIKSRIKGFVLS